MNTKSLRQALLFSALLSAPALCAKADIPLAFHGSVSVTAAISDKYNFLGDTNDSLDLNIAELTLNSSYRFPNGLRAMAQVYAYELAGYNDLMIDFANLDWQQNEKFGVRVGYSKSPSGFYNEVLDLDTIRPLAFLPTVAYPKEFRPIANNYLGLGLYGTLDASAVGSFEYNAYLGTKDSMSGDLPMFRIQRADSFMQFESISFKEVYGGSLIWNTPAEGLRFVLSCNWYPKIKIKGSVLDSAALSLQPSNYRALPQMAGVEVWDTYMAGTPGTFDVDYTNWRTGIEYTWKDFVFTIEYQGIINDIIAINAVTSNQPVASKQTSENYYGMVFWQATSKLGFGMYYGEGYPDRSDRSGDNRLLVPKHTAYTKELCLGVSYNVTDWFQIKAENHFMRGTSQIHNSNGINGDPSLWDESWNYFVLKSTLSF